MSRLDPKNLCFIKTATKDIEHLRYYSAIRVPNCFGVKLLEIKRL